MDAVDPSSGVFIVAQGLLMYLAPESVRQLFASIADRFPGSELVFDIIPRWFSHLTLLGLNQTASYRLPSMPWVSIATKLRRPCGVGTPVWLPSRSFPTEVREAYRTCLQGSQRSRLLATRFRASCMSR